MPSIHDIEQQVFDETAKAKRVIQVGEDGASKNPATEDNQDTQIDLNIREKDQLQEFIDSIKKEESGELYTIDENLRRVLGTEMLVANRKLNVNPIPDYFYARKNLAPATNAAFMIDVVGYNSLALQVLGTWTGTLTFECSVDGGNWIALNWNGSQWNSGYSICNSKWNLSFQCRRNYQSAS
jgi:hypothetical protein